MQQKVTKAVKVQWTPQQHDAHLFLSGVATGLGMLTILYLVMLLVEVCNV